MYADAATVFSAMAVESFLNLLRRCAAWGAFLCRTLRTARYYRSKLAALISCTLSRLLTDDEILAVVGRVSAARNRLVHPKTKEIDGENPFPLKSSWLIGAQNSVNDMERFFSLFLELDPAARWLIDGA